ncbi:hypothetical protein H4582DRAFT_2091912 [Lactarius indigo]|nr:hypothetical protein H4582DRAFT_2091912 [Lactarius indigo]
MSPTRRHRKSARNSSKQPQSRVRKVTLRLPQPDSSPSPAPGSLPPMSPPPPEVLPEVPHLPLTPHLPPHLPPSVAGLPVLNNSQHIFAGLPANAPPTYAHPYGPTFYPPAYPPVSYHHSYGPGISAAPHQPWGYAQYPMAPPPGPFLMDLPAPLDATTGEEGSPTARDTRGHVVNGPDDRAALGRGNGGGVGTNGAASLSTAAARPGRSYPNKEISAGIWEFRVEVVDENIKHTFNAHTDMKWYEFLDEVHRHFEKPRSEVRVGFRISGDAGAMSYLASEYDWDDAIARLMGKVRSARTRAVSMEIKNMRPSITSKAHGTKKGKEKRRREDDIPPEPTPDMLDHILELRQHLLCATHSKPGKKAYCAIEQSGENGKGGHKELTDEEISLWAKHISLKKTNKFTRPNVKTFDYPATKKSRTTHAPPEVHVSVNITPTLGVGSSKVQATYVPSRTVSPAPSPSDSDVTPTRGSPAVQALDMVPGPSPPSPSLSVPAQPNNNTIPMPGPIVPVPGPIVPAPEPVTVPVPVPIVPTPGHIAPIPLQVVHPSLLLVLLDALGTLTVPSLMDVLLLMDIHHPVGPRHVSLREELEEMGIVDVVDLYSLPVELLATFGWLRQSSARRLQEFCHDRFLFPLGFVEEIISDNRTGLNDSPFTQQMGVSDSEDGQPIDNVVDVVQTWLEEVEIPEEIEGSQMSVRSGEVDEGEENGDMATSQEV